MEFRWDGRNEIWLKVRFALLKPEFHSMQKGSAICIGYYSGNITVVTLQW